MGHKVTQTVNISGGGSSEGLIMAAVVVVGAWMVLGALAALVHALVMLLIWCSVVLGLAIVLAIVLGIVFRDRLKAYYGGPRVVIRGDTRPVAPPRTPVAPAAAPREIIHTHRHYIIGPTGLSSEMPGWDRLVDAEIVEEIGR